jgi:hypothetical protein
MTVMSTEGFCQHPTELNDFGLPVTTCGAPAVEYRPDRMFVRYVCTLHAGVPEGDQVVSTTSAAVAWIEQDYDEHGAFREPVFEEIHTPTGLFQIKANHIGDCHCETGEGEYWLSGSATMKWRAP